MSLLKDVTKFTADGCENPNKQERSMQAWTVVLLTSQETTITKECSARAYWSPQAVWFYYYIGVCWISLLVILLPSSFCYLFELHAVANKLLACGESHRAKNFYAAVIKILKKHGELSEDPQWPAYLCQNALRSCIELLLATVFMEVAVADKHSGIMMRQPLLASVLKQVRHSLWCLEIATDSLCVNWNIRP